MFKTFEDLQAINLKGFEAFNAAATAWNKGAQALVQEATGFAQDYAKKSAAHLQSAMAVKSIDKAFEAQAAFAKESFDLSVAEFSKLGDLAVATAKEAFKPFESAFASATAATLKAGK